jgi:hypothetical protein
MRRAVWIGILAVLAFALILFARFPAYWVMGTLPPGYSCDDVDGTLWSGSCGGLMLRHQILLGDLSWQLHPGRLFAGALAAHVKLTQPGGAVDGEAEYSLGGRLSARDVHGTLHLDPALLPQAPAKLRGELRADLSLIELQHGRLADLRGRIEAHNLEQTSGNTTALGDYALSFTGVAPGAALAGELHDLGGPLAVHGTLRMTPEPGFILEGKVATRASVAPELERQLQMLGPPDAQGQRSFSLADTF